MTTTEDATGRERTVGTEPARSSRAPLVLVAGAVAFNLVALRSESRFTPMLNDSSVHAQMVRAATAAFERGQLPLTSWYPYLGLGSPQFLHYQSLGAMLTGLAGVVVGPNRAFAWSLYLLVSLWPIAVYASGRLFGLSRGQAAVAAACAPFVFSTSTLLIGYEPGAYLWIGYGLWSQLWAMWTLPIAWGASWQYVRSGRYGLVAVLAGAATVAAHFMTGYLAVLPIVLWVLFANGRWRARIGRGTVYVVGVALCSAWVVYPVVHSGKWASQNEFLQHLPDADSYGARQAFNWLFSGALFDSGRLPVLSVLFALGLVTCAMTAHSRDHHRALIAVFCLSLVLFFGRPTLGPIINALPGSHDLFLRRFLVGVQMSAVLLAGTGAVAAKDLFVRLVRTHVVDPGRVPRAAAAVLSAAALVAVLYPAWHETSTYDSSNANDIALQRASDAGAPGAEIGAITTRLDRLPAGRVYAGLPAPTWGGSFTVGQIPVFKYLSNYDFDIVGYTLRTASLMTDPEAYFNEQNAGDYAVFGIRYLVLPVGRAPVPRATLLLTEGPFRLWEVDGPGARYVQLASTSGTVTADRTNIGARTEEFLDSDDPDVDLYQTVAFGGGPAAAATLPTGAATPSVGSVVGERDDLDRGRVTVEVDAMAKAAVVLKVSFDPGWQATVDGRAVTPYMVTPALVAVTVGPGRHAIDFTYRGYGDYPELFALAAGTVIVLGVGRRRIGSGVAGVIGKSRSIAGSPPRV